MGWYWDAPLWLGLTPQGLSAGQQGGKSPLIYELGSPEELGSAHSHGDRKHRFFPCPGLATCLSICNNYNNNNDNNNSATTTRLGVVWLLETVI